VRPPPEARGAPCACSSGCAQWEGVCCLPGGAGRGPLWSLLWETGQRQGQRCGRGQGPVPEAEAGAVEVAGGGSWGSSGSASGQWQAQVGDAVFGRTMGRRRWRRGRACGGRRTGVGGGRDAVAGGTADDAAAELARRTLWLRDPQRPAPVAGAAPEVPAPVGAAQTGSCGCSWACFQPE